MKRKDKINRKKTITFIAVSVFLLILFQGVIFTMVYLHKTEAFLSPIPLPQLEGTSHAFYLGSSSEQLKSILSEKGISFQSFTSFSESSYLITLQTGEEIIITSEKNMDEQVTSLQEITRALTIEGKRFKRLDLRFHNPVITFP